MLDREASSRPVVEVLSVFVMRFSLGTEYPIKVCWVGSRRLCAVLCVRHNGDAIFRTLRFGYASVTIPTTRDSIPMLCG